MTVLRPIHLLQRFTWVSRRMQKERDRAKELVVKTLTQPWHKSGRNVVGNNFFSSVELAEDLLSDGMMYVGTLRSNKPHVPEMMKASRKREEHSSLFGYHDQFTLASYVPKQGRAVLLLSTLHHYSAVSGPDKKLDAILHYNTTIVASTIWTTWQQYICQGVKPVAGQCLFSSTCSISGELRHSLFG